MDPTQRVLIVEDNPLEANHMRWLIREAGCLADIARDGRDGLERIRTQPPTLVVTDLLMPVMNGLELTERVAEEFPRLPVIVATGVGNEEVAAEALHRGAVSYVPKHRLTKIFVPTVRRILRRLYARGLASQFQTCFQKTELELQIGNDESLVPQIVASLIEHVRLYGFCAERELMHLGTALDESLLNAMVHGNLEVCSELRECTDGKSYRETIRERRQQAPYADRKVVIRLQLTRDEVRVVVADEGPGFDPSSVPDPRDPSRLAQASGRGLLLIRTFMDDVAHNMQGNEITLVKRRRVRDSRAEESCAQDSCAVDSVAERS